MRAAFADAGEPDAVVQTTNSDGSEGFLVRTTTTSAEAAAARGNQGGERAEPEHQQLRGDHRRTRLGRRASSSRRSSHSWCRFCSSSPTSPSASNTRWASWRLWPCSTTSSSWWACTRLVGREVTPEHHRRAAHHSGLLALRHRGRVPPHQRQHEGRSDVKCTFMTMANHSHEPGVHPLGQHHAHLVRSGSGACCCSAARR